jgi:tetratricopeptide (TPR) repeat protein
MTSLLNSLRSHNLTGVNAFSLSDLQRYSPSDIRVTIQALIAEDRTDLAVALGEAGISLYPDSEDMLAITGLLAAAQQDWSYAIERLTQLKTLQGERTQAFTYLMLARAHRCDLDPVSALETLDLALTYYPEDADLLDQHAQLKAEGVHTFSAVKAD